ncbi:MAG: DUF1015 domain-containing protein [Oscillospiraceae bacterium]|jgi:hypothetical protein|nr:DUF1015 domain-containing protein [Oscillospiraceae bacterium]
MQNIFRAANILLPKRDFETFVSLACDQFTSDVSYWDGRYRAVGGAPSAMKLIFPEAYLAEERGPRLDAIEKNSRRYLESGVFEEYPDSFILTERVLTTGGTRRGLVGVIDLEAYDYERDAPVAASERTVAERLPARREVRERQSVETSHVLALIDDRERGIIESADETKFEKLYDFALPSDAGTLRGWRVTGDSAAALSRKIDALPGGTKIIIGDGNHSLAAAKTLWEQIKPTLGAAERETHPLRFALAELCNVYDRGVEFFPIHRAAFGADSDALTAAVYSAVGGQGDYEIGISSKSGATFFRCYEKPLGEIIARVENALEILAAEVDYIHDEFELSVLVMSGKAAGVYMPAMSKSDFFETVRKSGVFPKKSFSIGHALDKRFCLECRRLAL